jgi:calcineurin-like phosphoesterase family protein
MFFFTSDHHFGHQRIIELASRPFGSVDEMNEELILRHNAVVGADDHVWFLGDVCMGKLDDSLALIGRLNGTKVLIFGNHDRMFRVSPAKAEAATRRYLDAGFAEVLPTQVSPASWPRRWTFSHFPPSGDHSEERFAEHRPVDDGGIFVHGHLHGQFIKNLNCVDVGVDAHNGFPVSAQRLGAIVADQRDHIPPTPWTKEWSV